MKTIAEMTINEFKEHCNKPLSTILREQKNQQKLTMMRTRTNTQNKKKEKKHEHKLDNNIRLQITIDCRIL